jgi:hypothetical protein
MANYADEQIAAALAAGLPGRAKLWRTIKAEVDDKAPPLTDVQRDQLKMLLRPDPVLPPRIPPRPAKRRDAVQPTPP